jgi:hypothetical protein
MPSGTEATNTFVRSFECLSVAVAVAGRAHVRFEDAAATARRSVINAVTSSQSPIVASHFITTKVEQPHSAGRPVTCGPPRIHRRESAPYRAREKGESINRETSCASPSHVSCNQDQGKAGKRATCIITREKVLASLTARVFCRYPASFPAR